MSLPSIKVPEFELTIPSTGDRINYRPFLVKEEKILYMAMEGEDPLEIAKAITNVAQDCVLTPGIDVSKLASFDLEYLFLKLRAKSVGEVAKIGLAHDEEVSANCDHITKIDVNIDDVEVKLTDADPNIMLTDDVGVVMQYPTLKDSNRIISEGGSKIDQTFSGIAYCIKSVFDQDNVYEEFTKQELVDWLQTLNKDQFGKILEWFRNMPTLEKEIEYTCPKCGKEEKKVLRGLMDFFE